MALPILMLGGALLRAAGPTIVRKLMAMGAKKATKQALKNAPKNIRTITSKNIGNVKSSRTLQTSASRMQQLKNKKPPTTTKKPPASTAKKPKTGGGKKTGAGSATTKSSASKKVPLAVAVIGGQTALTSVVGKGSGQKKAKASDTKKFGMGMVDDFGKGRKKGDMEGGTAPIKPKSKPKAKPRAKLEALPKKRPEPKVEKPKAIAKVTKKITAGPNVGFGPKGNIFPSNATERKKLMDKYGGTGSAAAKAAAQGKQGNLKKGKS